MKQTILMIAVVALRGCLATFTSDPSNPQNVIVGMEIRGLYEKPTSELTKADLEKVELLKLGSTQLTDTDLKELAKLQQLTDLDLRFTKITDARLVLLPDSTHEPRLPKPSQGFLSHIGAISVDPHAGFFHDRRESIVIWIYLHLGAERCPSRLRRMFSYSVRRSANIAGYKN